MPNADKPANDAPLTSEELDAVFAPLASLDRLLLAVSGGGDSLALMVLCHEWQARHSLPLILHVASVDHGLRPASGSECAFVSKVAAELGLLHATLSWRGDKPSANLQAEARAARLALLADHARSVGCSHIALAHHRDDQAETLIMRLLRGSGVTGLAAMRRTRAFDGLTLHRPLLDLPKARLIASLEARGRGWVEDPSNQSADYLRVRVRTLLPDLAMEGCDSARLAATAHRLNRADRALDAVTATLFQTIMRAEPGRALSFALAGFDKQEEEFRLRLLQQALVHVAGPAYPPREERLLALDAALVGRAGSIGKRTLGGCCFEFRQGRVWIYRELGRSPLVLALRPGEDVDWMGLYSITAWAEDSLCLRALGEDGRALLAQQGLTLSSGQGEHLPHALIEALPSIWREGQPIVVVDWSQVAQNRAADTLNLVEIREKHTKFANNASFM